MQYMLNLRKKIYLKTNFEISNINNKYIPNFSDIQIVIHHYADRGLYFKKNIGKKQFSCGVGNLLKELNNSNISCMCFVADGKDNYFENLEREFSNIRFLKTSSKYYDFGTYETASRIAKNEKKYFCFLNDNIDTDSNVIEFLKSAKYATEDPLIGIVGSGYNTELRQSLFNKTFRPHIQTFCFFVKSDIFHRFLAVRGGVNQMKYIPFKKQIICRMYEIGLSAFILGRGMKIAIIKGKILYKYSRRFSSFDLKVDWNLVEGDSRFIYDLPFNVGNEK